ncbi:hypothetical protein [Candidatus Thiodiazotropha endoloripes]|nr:hypothetical protein [Candidatus Thiodiazotropha endoloripes]
MHYLILPFSLGFITVSNFSLNPATEGSFRLLDIVILTFSTVVVLRVLLTKMPIKPLVITFIIGAYLLTWMLYSYSIEDDRGIITTGRMLAGLLTSLLLVTYWRNTDVWVIPFLTGLSFGGISITIIAIGQHLNLGEIFHALKPSSAQVWWVLGETRETSIYSHPNGFSHHAMIGSIAALSCININNQRQNVIHNTFYLLIFLFITLGVYYTAETRSVLLIAALAITQLYFNQKRTIGTLLIGLLGFFVLLLSPIYIENILGERWFAETNSGLAIIDNIQGRLNTTLSTLGYIIVQPLGYGIAERTNILIQEFGIIASHNSILSIGMSFGLFLSVTIIIGYYYSFKTLIKNKSDITKLNYLLVSTLISLLMEDIIYSSTMALVIPLLIYAGSFLPIQSKYYKSISNNV